MIAGLAIGAVLGAAVVAAWIPLERRFKAWQARKIAAAEAARQAKIQADWEDHVAGAVQMSETPLYDTLAATLARDVDTEWADLNGEATR